MQGSHIILHGLHNREDLNGMVRMVGDFDDGKARWAIKTRKGESIWVKDANLLPANSMEAKAIFMANYEETRVMAEASEQRLQQVDEEVKKNRGSDSQIAPVVRAGHDRIYTRRRSKTGS